MNKIPLIVKIQILLVNLWIKWLNFWLKIFNNILFFRKINNPRDILIYKIGNIGDIICATPSFIAIRRFYSGSKITLLTSPGKRNAIGAKELLGGVWYLDKMKIYYADDIDSLDKKKKFIKDLRSNNYDLFIQIPDDLANFRTLLRNMIFAKFIGVKSAFGFKIRTAQSFKKIQVDYTAQKTEVESLLEILKENEIKMKNVEFDFNISEEQKNKIKKLIKNKWNNWDKKNLIVAISSGGKRESNQWPIERFAGIAKYLQDKYNAKIIAVGGKDDVWRAEIIKSELGEENILITAGELDILETLELLKYCSFLISNSTGIIHLAAAAGIPVVGLYSIRDVFGRWFPYGRNHKILFHKFINCDYMDEKCIKISIDSVTINGVEETCDNLIRKILL